MDKGTCTTWKATVYISATFTDDKVDRLLLLLPILFSNVLKSGLGDVGALSDPNRPMTQLGQSDPLLWGRRTETER